MHRFEMICAWFCESVKAMADRACILRALCCFALAVPATSAAQGFDTIRVVGPGGLDRPVSLTAPREDMQRVFILEQHTGEIRILNRIDWSLNAAPFLTIPNLATDTEQGLLGLAFHPAYASNGLFYVNYNRASDGATVIAQYRTSTDPNIAISDETVLLTIDQPRSNHNGGWIGFAPDGRSFLYISTGDGGGANDIDDVNDNGPDHTPGIGNGQDITNLLGKILRIDVDGDDFPEDATRNYAIPSTNPFFGSTGADEIWSYGLRNPYRASFDRDSGHLYIGDVGQDNREEINVQPANEAELNFGWRLREGTIATPTGSVGGEASQATDPIFEYPHTGSGFAGDAVVGGIVYRGPIESLFGVYFFADFVTGRLWSLRFDGSDSSAFDGTNFTDLTDHTLEGDPRFIPDEGSLDPISAFGEDANGNLYLVKFGSSTSPQTDTGEIFFVPEPASRALSAAVGVTLAILRSGRRGPKRR